MSLTHHHHLELFDMLSYLNMAPTKPSRFFSYIMNKHDTYSKYKTSAEKVLYWNVYPKLSGLINRASKLVRY